jgi:hypothetical protein
MTLFSQIDYHVRPTGISIIQGLSERNIKRVKFCDRLQLWQAKVVVDLSKDDQIMHGDSPGSQSQCHSGHIAMIGLTIALFGNVLTK